MAESPPLRLDLLRRVPYFAGLDDEVLGALVGVAGCRHYSRGQVIFLEGDPCAGLYIVAAGEVKIFKLSPQGRERASRLAKVLLDAGITKIFVSEYGRTAQTAAPLAAHLGIKPDSVAADDLATLLHLIRATGSRARVLVIGHSDTIPALLNALGCKPQVTIAKGEYDNLFVVVRGSDGQPVLVRLRF
jgi:hypothetical protein